MANNHNNNHQPPFPPIYSTSHLSSSYNTANMGNGIDSDNFVAQSGAATTKVSRRRPYPYDNDKDNSGINSNELIGVPWQAMKRLRVDATSIEQNQAHTVPYQANSAATDSASTDMASTSTPAITSASNGSEQTPSSNKYNDHFYFYQGHQRQETGRDTMSDGWSSPEISKKTVQSNTDSFVRCNHNRIADADGGNSESSVHTFADDMDYQNVNQILGNLHFERQQRSTQPIPRHEQGRSINNEHQYNMNEGSPMISTPATLPTTPLTGNTQMLHQLEQQTTFYDQFPYNNNNNNYNHQTPPPKPTKRKVKHLYTSSKLG